MAKVQSITSENIIIGALISDLNLLLSLPELKSEYFSTKLNQTLLKVLKNIFKDGGKSAEILDIYALIETDENAKKMLDDIGGLEHLETLRIIGEDKDESEVTIHANNIIECSFKNDMVDTLIGLTNFVETKQETKMESINKLIEKELLELKTKYSQLNKIELLGSRLANIKDEIKNARQGSSLYGLPTFSPLLNKFFTYEKGELVVIAGKAKSGKSQLTVNEVYRLSIMNNIPTLVLDTELDDKFFTIRLVARITGYNSNYIKLGLYEKNEVANKKVMDAFEKIANAPIMHQYIVGWTKEQILNEVKRTKIQHNVQVLFYDYIKVEDANENEHRELGNLTNFLKNDIAGALKIAVVAFAQMSDYSDSSRLKIANSERIKNYASTVVFLVEKTIEQYGRDFNEKGGNYYLFIAYNRNGFQFKMDENEKGINIYLDKTNSTFIEANYQHDEIYKLIEEQEQWLSL